MPQFHYETYLPFSREDVFTWYTRAGALTRLHPAFAGSVRQEPPNGPVNGSGSVITLNLPGLLGTSATAAAKTLSSMLPFAVPSSMKWTSRHEDFEQGRSFSDVMVSGPMRSWRHYREFIDDGSGTMLRETVTYEFPALSHLPQAVTKQLHRVFENELLRVFDFRTRQTTEDLAFHQAHGTLESQQHDAAANSAQMRDFPRVVAVSGASGMVGPQVCALLGGAGIKVRHLVRRDLSSPNTSARRNSEDIAWDPENQKIDDAALAEVDAVIHLAGHPLASRFTAEHKRKVRDSRIKGTTLIADSLARAEETNPRGRTLISSSAIGWYGATSADRAHGHEVLHEDIGVGTDFLAGVCDAWENAARRAEDAGVRVAMLRTGIVQSPSGGALQQLLPIFAAGAGGPLGEDQVQSWISLDDLASLTVHLLLNSEARGPVNGVAPNPVTAHDYAKTLGNVLRRPSAIPVPAFGPKLLLGAEGAQEIVFADQHVSAEKALHLGYGFRHPDLETALRHILGRH
ncbi:TIGR01777 family oxidoreductase [Nesterenkonia haasae]|uniref:TIGR01777 family oxidoreductase n=1 Tax=Nesterenkonia haasae TaxID=2587813 RepID=UPI0013920BC5|nr:TIGR01777 family oxidoreductase [Nesterenkonia haasae]NDK32938.1 TIGR01777 family protein [Nesterenkonia haasae]